MSRLINDKGFPFLGKDPQDGHRLANAWSADVSIDWNGFTAKGTVVPSILNMGHILGVAQYSGLPAPGDDLAYALQPASGADVIVTVLYQRSRHLLRRFLEFGDAEEFTYAHYQTAPGEGREERKPFVIVRNGDRVEAGFREGYVDGAVSPHWHEVVRYTIQLTGAWRQDFLQLWDLDESEDVVGMKRLKLKSLVRDADRGERGNFQKEAVRVLTSALTGRLWIEQPGFKIEAVFTPLETSSVSEAAEETGSGQAQLRKDQDGKDQEQEEMWHQLSSPGGIIQLQKEKDGINHNVT